MPQAYPLPLPTAGAGAGVDGVSAVTHTTSCSERGQPSNRGMTTDCPRSCFVKSRVLSPAGIGCVVCWHTEVQ